MVWFAASITVSTNPDCWATPKAAIDVAKPTNANRGGIKNGPCLSTLFLLKMFNLLTLFFTLFSAKIKERDGVVLASVFVYNIYIYIYIYMMVY